MTEQMFKDAFERLADRAEPVDGLAERALRRAARRRSAALSGGVLGVAAAISAPMFLLGGGTSVEPGPATVSPPMDGLPVNTPAEQQIVRACLRGASPTGPMGDPQAQFGKPSDFRLLTSVRVGAETVATVGSTRGFVLCTQAKEGNTMPPWFHPWPGTAYQGLWNFAGEGRIDGVTYQSRTGKGGLGTSFSGLHHLITGRVKPGVARVVITWDRGRQVDAAVRNGFFLARVDSTLIKNTNPDKTTQFKITGSPKGPTESWEPREERILSVQAFNSAGGVLFHYKAPAKGLQQFDSNDCQTAPAKTKPNPLCTAPR